MGLHCSHRCSGIKDVDIRAGETLPCYTSVCVYVARRSSPAGVRRTMHACSTRACHPCGAIHPQAFCAVTNEIIWLIVVSFFFAKVRSSPVLHPGPPWPGAALSLPCNKSAAPQLRACCYRQTAKARCTRLECPWPRLRVPMPTPARSLLRPSPSLPCAALLPAQGFEKTGLGERIATLFVRALGKSTLGLSYGLNVAEALMAPAMPSTSARAGGIFVPIIKSLAGSVGSEPGAGGRAAAVREEARARNGVGRGAASRE
jgi:hypothetical protein